MTEKLASMKPQGEHPGEEGVIIGGKTQPPRAGVDFCAGGERCFTHRNGRNGSVPCSGGVSMYLIPTLLTGARDNMTFSEHVLEFERNLIAAALKRNNGHMLEASRDLGMDRTALRNMLVGGRHKSLRAMVKDRPKGKPGHRATLDANNGKEAQTLDNP